jgi:hypothetical protein
MMMFFYSQQLPLYAVKIQEEKTVYKTQKFWDCL